MSRPNGIHPLALAGIVSGNLVPLLGVLYWHWTLFEIFYLYWIENVIIGVFTLIRLLLAGAAEGLGTLFGSLFLCAFFTVHYGMFCMGHGMIMTEIFFMPEHQNFDLTETTLFLIPWMTEMGGFIWALAGIVLVELIYQTRAFLDDRALGRGPNVIMFAPYGRIIILHLTIIIGGLLAETLGFPPIALIFLIVLKTFYDLGLYSYGPQMAAPKENTQT